MPVIEKRRVEKERKEDEDNSKWVNETSAIFFSHPDSSFDRPTRTKSLPKVLVKFVEWFIVDDETCRFNFLTWLLDIPLAIKSESLIVANSSNVKTWNEKHICLLCCSMVKWWRRLINVDVRNNVFTPYAMLSFRLTSCWVCNMHRRVSVCAAASLLVSGICVCMYESLNEWMNGREGKGREREKVFKIRI